MNAEMREIIAARQKAAETLHNTIVGYYIDGKLTTRELVGQLEQTKAILIDSMLNGGR